MVCLFLSRSEWQAKRRNWIFHFSKHFWPIGTLEKVKDFEARSSTGYRIKTSLFKKGLYWTQWDSWLWWRIQTVAVSSVVACDPLERVIKIISLRKICCSHYCNCWRKTKQNKAFSTQLEVCDSRILFFIFFPLIFLCIL